MSTIQASNLNDGTISVPTTYLTNGSAKAWVYFNGSGTVAVIDGNNVSSVTDNGTGSYSPNFTSSFANNNYAVGVSFQRSSLSAFMDVLSNSRATGSSTVRNLNTGGGAEDPADVSATFHGDLA